MTVVANAPAVATIAAGKTTVARRRAQHLRCRAAAAGGAGGNQDASSSSAKEVVLSPEDLVRAQYKSNEAQDFGDSILGGASIVEGTKEEMRDLVPFGANNLAVLRATKQYAEAFEAGLDPSQVVANVLGRAPSNLYTVSFLVPLRRRARTHTHFSFPSRRPSLPSLTRQVSHVRASIFRQEWSGCDCPSRKCQKIKRRSEWDHLLTLSFASDGSRVAGRHGDEHPSASNQPQRTAR